MVRDTKVHEEVIAQVMTFASSLGFSLLDLEYSPIKGPEGNIEYLLHLENAPGKDRIEESVISKVVKASKSALSHQENV